MIYKIGDQASITRTLSEEAITKYAEASGDYNLIHLDDDFARNKGFEKGRIAHGLFCIGMVSYLIGVVLPGDGTIFLDEELRYYAPVYLLDEITATVKIININNNVLTFGFECVNQDDLCVLKGKTKVIVR